MADLEAESEKTRAEVATYLREFADKLDPRMEGADPGSEKVTIIVDNESATVNPPEMLRFGVGAKTDSSLLDAGADRGITFSLTWDKDQVETDEGFDVE